MTTLWNICAWTGLVVWCVLVSTIIGITVGILIRSSRDEYGELFIEDPDQ
jgi:ABC-type proline/glycine betaine transport system permease subunit